MDKDYGHRARDAPPALRFAIESRHRIGIQAAVLSADDAEQPQYENDEQDRSNDSETEHVGICLIAD